VALATVYARASFVSLH